MRCKYVRLFLVHMAGQMQRADVATSPLSLDDGGSTSSSDGSDDDASTDVDTQQFHTLRMAADPANNSCVSVLSEAQYQALVQRVVAEFRSFYFAQWAAELRAQRPTSAQTLASLRDQVNRIQETLAAKCQQQPWEALEERLVERIAARVAQRMQFERAAQQQRQQNAFGRC